MKIRKWKKKLVNIILKNTGVKSLRNEIKSGEIFLVLCSKILVTNLKL